MSKINIRDCSSYILDELNELKLKKKIKSLYFKIHITKFTLNTAYNIFI